MVDYLKRMRVAKLHALCMLEEPGDWTDGEDVASQLEIAKDKAIKAHDALALIKDALDGKCICKGSSVLYGTTGGISPVSHTTGEPIAHKFCVVHGNIEEMEKLMFTTDFNIE